MIRTNRSKDAWLVLAYIVGTGAVLTVPVGGTLPALDTSGDFDRLGHGAAFALPPPGLCSLCPIVDEPALDPLAIATLRVLVTDDGHRLPLASRAPPAQA